MRAWADSQERLTHNKGEVHVSDQTTSGVGAPEHPTAETVRPKAVAAVRRRTSPRIRCRRTDPGLRRFPHRAPGPRTERREAQLRRRHAPPAGMPPWDSTPVTGIPRVDPTAFGAYYNGQRRCACAIPAEPRTAPSTLPHTPYPELSTGMLLRPIKPPPSEGWRRLLYFAVRSADQPGGEPSGRSPQQLGGRRSTGRCAVPIGSRCCR